MCCRCQETLAENLRKCDGVTRNCGIDVFDVGLPLPAHMCVWQVGMPLLLPNVGTFGVCCIDPLQCIARRNRKSCHVYVALVMLARGCNARMFFAEATETWSFLYVL